MSSAEHGSFMDSFDYRSLLPGGGGGGGNGRDRYSLLQSSTSLEYAEPMDTTGAGGGVDDDCCTCFPEMTWRERLLGCATCMIAGYLLSLGSFWRVKDMMLGNPVPLVLNATIGNVIALAGSCFLSGPRSQFHKMWHDSRRVATTMYIGSLVLTLLLIWMPKFPLKGIMLLLLIVAQYISITWYCLSYIPFAREAISNFVRRQLARG